jgi:hypothetical protein
MQRTKEWELTPEAFEHFLDWLDADREQAGRKYEAIRRGLIAIFNSRGCFAAEDLADETINRAIRQLSSIEGSYEGDPAKYLHGIARFVALEYFNRQVRRYAGPVPEDLPDPPRPDEPVEEDEREALSRSLRHCLEKLKPEKRKSNVSDRLNDQINKIRLLFKQFTPALPQTRITFYLFVSGLAGFILLSALTDQEEIVALGTLNIAIIGMWIWALLRKAHTLTQSLTPPKGDAPEV